MSSQVRISGQSRTPERKGHSFQPRDPQIFACAKPKATACRCCPPKSQR